MCKEQLKIPTDFQLKSTVLLLLIDMNGTVTLITPDAWMRNFSIIINVPKFNEKRPRHLKRLIIYHKNKYHKILVLPPWSF